MDEVGADLNMMNDGHIGGMRFITRKGNNATLNCTKKSKKYTVLGLTNLLGQPIMCVVIFEEKERNPLLESGIDTTHPLSSEFDGEITEDNTEFFKDNYGAGKLFPGGPVCEFEGVEIPTMVRYSEKGSISGDILKDILLTLDTLDAFKTYRENGAVPFLLVDGHQSRFSLPFLEYISDPDHAWKVSIGVPYGTSMWQVGDSYQQNGRFKISLTKQKKELIESRIDNFTSDIELLPTDIIPMINKAWEVSFADEVGNVEAIYSRGWFPLTRKLLLHPSLRLTMTEEDKQFEEELELLPAHIENLLNDQASNKSNNDLLSFNSGYAATFIDRLVGQQDIERARARNHIKKQAGANTKTLMKQIKRLTSAGELVRVANTHEIGKTILEEVMSRRQDMQAREEEKKQKKLHTHLKNVGELVRLREKKPNDKDWNSSQLKIAIKAVKTNEDGKIPTLKQELVDMWNILKHREVGIFNGLDDEQVED